jgi:hypothetical protein
MPSKTDTSDDTSPHMSLGTVEITTPKTQLTRMSAFIWGPSGAGKTTLAATAPRPILWINFDPDGTSSLMDQDGIFIADFSLESSNKIVTFKNESAGGIRNILDEHPEIKTVVVDSVTSLNAMALAHAVTETKSATMEAPTLAGYGRRNSYTLQAVSQIIKTTGKYNKHVVFVAHEDVPDKDELTGAMMVSILVGGKMRSELPIKLSEVWHLEDTGKDRIITIRANRLRKPMKSRMFLQSGESNFKWKFDPEEWEGDGIEAWYDAWVDNGGKKLPLPK